MTNPTRHGNWHRINGELVDLAAQPPIDEPNTAPVGEAHPDTGEPVSGKARRRKANTYTED
ncbi:MAG: hypothetical protein Q4G71_10010 [Pseudomonadota bacterium]|nr:hypothetical protein [Pseudomonadota bacterium]